MDSSVIDNQVHIIDGKIVPESIIKDLLNTLMQESAFYVCDIGEVIRKYETWIKRLPRVQPFYAVKCNDTPIILALLAHLGTGFDCASLGEIAKVLNLNVQPERIIFANPAKLASHIRYAENRNVEMMTFDGESELFKTKKYFPEAKLVLRIRYDDEEANVCLGIKYGCDPITEAPGLLRLAKKIGMEVIGIAFHVGLGCHNPTIFYKAMEASRRLFDYAEDNLGYKMTLLDIGGGFPGDNVESFHKIADCVNKAIETFFKDTSVKIISEPGSYFVTSAYTLVCNVYASRTTLVDSKEHHMYFINDGVYGSFNGKHKDGVDLKVTPKLLRKYDTPKYQSSIWGPTLDSADIICQQIILPKLDIGDWLMFENLGAYSVCAAGTFNALPIPEVHWVIDKENWERIKVDDSLQWLVPVVG